MTVTTPQQIIAAFDEILDYVYGRNRGRDYESKDDAKYAQDWIDQGLTIPIASAVFYQRMEMMHERWLRNHDPHSQVNYPAVLKLFHENIFAALNRVKQGGEQLAVWELSESKWKARLNGWYGKKLWNRDMFGPTPDEPDCRCPPRLMAEAKKKDNRG